MELLHQMVFVVMIATGVIGELRVKHEDKYLTVSVNDGQGVERVIGKLVDGFTGEPSNCAVKNSGDICLKFGHTELRVTRNEPPLCTLVTGSIDDPEGAATGKLIMCTPMDGAHWFGGPEQFNQVWPIEKANFTDYSYVTKQQDNQGIAEPYWLNSNGSYIYVEPDTPLFIDQNHNVSNHLCFIAQNSAPYHNTRPTLILNYTFCVLDDARQAHQHAIQNFLGKPSGIPDEQMIRHPIWSTWARYKVNVDEPTVLEFANEITDNGFNNSQLELDDFWETCYGSLTFDKKKFPDMKSLSDTLKSKGFRVTLWIHPFINLDCEPYFSEALENGYFVKDTSGNTNSTWWNGKAAVIDFTNPAAVSWWVGRLRSMLEENGIDSLKFDAGETSWLPQIPVLSADEYLQPSIYTTKYTEAVSQFGPIIEVRVAQRTQNLPIFVRMLDKDSKWDFRNGLPTLITTLLQMNMVGYPLVLPDMVGGNGYGDIVTKELFIRWLQANVFMPSIQYSYVPWDYDDETIAICKKYTDLHAQYTDKIVELMKKSVQDGSPLNPPIWWIDPLNEEAQAIDSEFLLGEDILVAPVLQEGATSRDIYLPRGLWRNEVHPDQEPITGPTWLRDFPAALDQLPYFTRVG